MSVREKMKRQIEEISKTLYDMEEVIEIYCLSKATDLTIMLLGPHATAKSSLARMWSKTCGLEYRIVTASEVDESLIAYIDPAVFREKNVVQMRRGELMEKDHIIIDEFFMWLGKYRAKLHQLLEERTYAGLDVLTKTWTFLSNPFSEYYPGQIEEINWATIDRIDIFVPVFQAKILPSQTMVRKFSEFGRKEKPLEQVITWDDYLKAREEIRKIEVPSRINVWLSLFAHSLSSCKLVKDKFSMDPAKLRKLCSGCNENNHLCAKVSLSKPRYLRATIILAKGLAWLDGRDYVQFQDIYKASKYTLPHRIVWLEDEKTYHESFEEVNELIQSFNEEMLVWKNRGLFNSLGKVIKSSQKEPPYFEEELLASLAADVSEIHVLKSFVQEIHDIARTRVKDYYLREGKEKKFRSIQQIKNFLSSSGLSTFDVDDLVFKIALPTSLGIIFTKSSDNVNKLIDAIADLHRHRKKTIDPKLALSRRFEEKVIFESDLLKIRENERKRKIEIVCANKEIAEELREGLK